MDDWIKREDTYNTLADYYHHRTETQHDALRDALSRVPAANVAPVRHGSWIKHENDDAIWCSVCGLGFESFIAGAYFRFCPFCGALMDKDGDGDV